MADNYLEKRMEELRNGKISGELHKYSTPVRRSGLNFSFPSKRICIISENRYMTETAKMFVKAGSKVALMHTDTVSGQEMAQKDGIKYYPLPHQEISESQSSIDQTIRSDFHNLLRCWRDIDILIVDSRILRLITEEWRQHRSRYPYTSDYICRIIVLADSSSELMIEQDTKKLLKSTLNTIIIPEESSVKNISSLVGMLTLPDNYFIDNMTFEIPT